MVVDPQHAGLSITRQCRLVSITRSSFYYARRGDSPLNLRLMRRIDEQFLETPFYGSRQMTRWLRRQGNTVSRKRVRRLMRLLGVHALFQRPRTSQPHPAHRIYPYLLRDLQITRPNHVWCTDVTYIPLQRGFLYLVAVMDWASRKVLSWRLSNTLDAHFCVEALHEALEHYGRTSDLDAEIETLRTQKAVPTKDDLAAARTRRDKAFGLLRDQWEKGRNVEAETLELLGEGTLIKLYPRAVTAADEVADRLRNEAERVAELAQHLDERERLSREIEEADSSSNRAAAAGDKLAATWLDLWKSVVTDPPQIHDARAWFDDFSRLLERTEAIVDARRRYEQLDAWIEQQMKSLGVAMTALDPAAHPIGGLSVTVAASEKLRQRIEKEEHVRTDHARKTIEVEQENPRR